MKPSLLEASWLKQSVFVIITISLLLTFAYLNYFDYFDFIQDPSKLANEPVSRSLQTFERIHSEILSGKRRLKLSINWYPPEGYGNKLYSMITSMVIALLTDSAILIRWDAIHNFIREPFNLSFHDYAPSSNFVRYLKAFFFRI